MLRKIRITLALIFIIGITLLFVDFSGSAYHWTGWMAKIQFLPALLALNVAVVVGLILLTLLFGRVYCSVICPLGVMQDIASWISGKRKRHKARFGYAPAHNVMRTMILALFVAAVVLGATSWVAIIAPYSAYGRIASNLLAPVWALGNNLLVHFIETGDHYLMPLKEVWLKSLTSLVIAAVTFVALTVIAWRWGRLYCNTVCPVGTLLGFLSRFSLFRIAIDTSKCNSCGLCARKCKSMCINDKAHTIDNSRCVVCMDCIDNCHKGAISYTLRHRHAKNADVATGEKHDPIDGSRRSFLAIIGSVAATATLSARNKRVDGGLAVIEDKKAPQRLTRIVPAGAASIRNFEQHCTACQLCVSACPNNVLRPSADLATLMQPEISYERGYCRPECTRCSEVCPSGAIRPITAEKKSATHIGHAVWIPQNCIPLTNGDRCGNCARHCPAGAIKMIHSKPDDDHSPWVPMIDAERCIGCGACENLCPARPFSAIYVEGHEVHRIN